MGWLYKKWTVISNNSVADIWFIVHFSPGYLRNKMRVSRNLPFYFLLLFSHDNYQRILILINYCGSTHIIILVFCHFPCISFYAPITCCFGSDILNWDGHINSMFRIASCLVTKCYIYMWITNINVWVLHFLAFNLCLINSQISFQIPLSSNY